MEKRVKEWVESHKGIAQRRDEVKESLEDPRVPKVKKNKQFPLAKTKARSA